MVPSLSQIESILKKPPGVSSAWLEKYPSRLSAAAAVSSQRWRGFNKRSVPFGGCGEVCLRDMSLLILTQGGFTHRHP